MPQKGDKHGRIGRLDEQTLGYYRRVQQTLNDGFENETDDKELFIRNVFNTLCTEAMPVSQNQTASNIVQRLLQEANIDQLVCFGKALSVDWETACTDRFASHVTQTLVSQLGLRLSEERQSDDALNILTEVYSFLMSSLAFYMQHTYASHIVRTMIETLSGIKCSDWIIRSRVARQGKGSSYTKETTIIKSIREFLPLLNEMCDKIIKLGKMKDHIKNHLSNPVLQTVLLVLGKSDPDKCKQMCKYFVDEIRIFSNDTKDENDDTEISLPELVQHEIGSHFVEQVIQMANADLLDEILNNFLLDKVLVMALHPTANFILQKLIKCCTTAEQFKTIFKMLSQHLESILCLNHTQVIVCLAENCTKFGTGQKKFTKALMKAFHCYSPEERQIKCLPLFASMNAYETFYKQPFDSEEDSDSNDEKEIKYPELTEINLHGSLLLQQMLQFGNPKQLITSLLHLKPSELRTMACDPCGSHIIEMFFKSSTIGEKSRDVLYQRLKGFYCDLACSRHGSRTLDTMFNTAPIKHKFTIVEELNRHESKVQGDKFGRIIWRNYNMNTFKRNKNDWKQRQLAELKKRKLFQDIFNENPPCAKREKTAAVLQSENNLSQDEQSPTEEQTEEEKIYHKGKKRSRKTIKYNSDSFVNKKKPKVNE